jgi:hypothetical protein
MSSPYGPRPVPFLFAPSPHRRGLVSFLRSRRTRSSCGAQRLGDGVRSRAARGRLSRVCERGGLRSAPAGTSAQPIVVPSPRLVDSRAGRDAVPWGFGGCPSLWSPTAVCRSSIAELAGGGCIRAAKPTTNDARVWRFSSPPLAILERFPSLGTRPASPALRARKTLLEPEGTVQCLLSLLRGPA